MTDDVVSPTSIDHREDDGTRTLARLRDGLCEGREPPSQNQADAGDAEEWATARTKLGFAYAQRSEGDRSENWELAIAAFTEALSARSRAASPEEWAAANANLGVAYRERVAGDRSENQERAITAFEDALAVWTLEGNDYRVITPV